MCSELALRIFERQAQAVGEELEAWKAEHRGAMRAGDVEGLIRALSRLTDELERTWEVVNQKARSGLLTDPEGAGRYFLEGNGHLLSAMIEFDSLARDSEAAGHPVENRSELLQQMSRVRAVGEAARKAWPWLDDLEPEPDPAQLAESEAAYQRGEYEDVRDIIRGLQSPRPEAG